MERATIIMNQPSLASKALLMMGNARTRSGSRIRPKDE